MSAAGIRRHRWNAGAAPIALRSSNRCHGRQCRRAAVRDIARSADGQTSDASVSGRRSSETTPRLCVHRTRVAMVGHGTWAVQTRSHCQRDHRAMRRLFSQRSGWSLIEQMMQPAESSRINETAIAQPATFAVQIALRRAAGGMGRPARRRDRAQHRRDRSRLCCRRAFAVAGGGRCLSPQPSAGAVPAAGRDGRDRFSRARRRTDLSREIRRQDRGCRDQRS